MYHTDTLYDVKLKFGNPVKNKIQSVTTHILNKFKQDSIVIEYLPNGDEASRTVYYYGSNHKLQKSVRSSKMVFGFGVSVDGIDNDTIVTSYSYKYDDNQKVVESLAKELL